MGNVGTVSKLLIDFEELRSDLKAVRSVGQFLDAEAECGEAYHRAMRFKLVPFDKELDRLGLIGENHAEDHTSTKSSDAYRKLFRQAAGVCRLVLKPSQTDEPELSPIDTAVPGRVFDGGGPDSVYEDGRVFDGGGPDSVYDTAFGMHIDGGFPDSCHTLQTNIEQDYLQQARRYARFCSELLAELQHGTPQVVEAQPQAESKPKGRNKRTDPQQHVNKLRQKIENGYTYPGNYPGLMKDIGGSQGIWTKIFADPENADLVEWKENRSICARNSPAAEQAAYEDEEFIPDEDLEKMYDEEVKKLPKQNREQAWEQFRKMPIDLQRKYIAGTRS